MHFRSLLFHLPNLSQRDPKNYDIGYTFVPRFDASIHTFFSSDSTFHRAYILRLPFKEKRKISLCILS